MTCCTQSHCPQRRLRFGGDRQGASKTFRAVPPENRPVPQKVYRRPVMRRQEPAERSRHTCGTSPESSMLTRLVNRFTRHPNCLGCQSNVLFENRNRRGFPTDCAENVAKGCDPEPAVV